MMSPSALPGLVTATITGSIDWGRGALPRRTDRRWSGTQGERAMKPLESLIAAGTKVWLDSVDPAEVARNRALGATGATSNPIIVADIIKSGHYDEQIS